MRELGTRALAWLMRDRRLRECVWRQAKVQSGKAQGGGGVVWLDGFDEVECIERSSDIW